MTQQIMQTEEQTPKNLTAIETSEIETVFAQARDFRSV
jgi:hypothetical protein